MKKKRSRRIARELKTIEVMIGMYCRAHHGTRGEICDECAGLLDYAEKRLDKCPYGMDKPQCTKCPIHCYKKDMREQVKTVMRYSGPRMMLRHPILAIFHLIDGRRETPPHPKDKKNSADASQNKS